MRRCWRFLILAVFLGASPAVVASQQDCSEPFFGGQAPALLNAKLRERTRQLCFSQFTLLHSGVTRGPLWSAEDLSRANLTTAVSLPRPSSNTFHEEDLLPADERSTLDDYRRSGFDRGHMTPNSDMSNPQAQQESFTLANIVPQDACNNEVLWEGVESAVRALTLGEGEVFVVTGPAFIGAELDSLKGRVMVPTHIFKAVYIPSRDEAGAYWAPNDDSHNWEAISEASRPDGHRSLPSPRRKRQGGSRRSSGAHASSWLPPSRKGKPKKDAIPPRLVQALSQLTLVSVYPLGTWRARAVERRHWHPLPASRLSLLP